jgi:hypothetical protein
MKYAGWRYAVASAIGTSHLKGGSNCQDASECTIVTAKNGEVVLVAVASDGAGSAKFAEIGSKEACKTLTEQARAWIEAGGEVRGVTQEMSHDWLHTFQGVLKTLADSDNATIREYACTILLAIVSTDHAVFMQIGDGAIVVKGQDAEEYDWVFWPERGEYENTTFFASEDNADRHFQYEFVNRRVDELALFTDGLQRLALDLRTNLAHAPFFRSLFPPLRNLPEGRSEELSKSLATFLMSPRVNERTDDDKTLILATRLSATEISPLTA